MSAEARSELVDWARETIAAGSKSFGMASRLLPRRERENAWLLYAWCRACDDITDGQELGFYLSAHPPVSTDLWEQTRRALRTDAAVPLAFASLREVHRDAGLPVRYIEDHLCGFDLDRAGWRPQTAEDLIGYCYHVAGTVGCLMARIMGISPQDADTLARASDLGIAFQLDNIARDIVEDARHGRCYIPADWLSGADIEEAALAEPEHRPKLADLARELRALATRYYGSARVGAARLPWRSRNAILAACNIYGAIGETVVRRGALAWDDRITTTRVDKLVAAGRAVVQGFGGVADPGRSGLFDQTAWHASRGSAKAQIL